MAEILIKNMILPIEGEQINITILSDGSVIEHFRNESGTWSSYRSGGVKAIELPPHGRLIDVDANREDFMDTVYSELYSDGDNYRANRIIDAYDNAPTVLEAST